MNNAAVVLILQKIKKYAEIVVFSATGINFLLFEIEYYISHSRLMVKVMSAIMINILIIFTY